MEALLSDRRAVQELGHKTLRQKLRQVAKEVEGLDARRQEAERSAKESNAQYFFSDIILFSTYFVSFFTHDHAFTKLFFHKKTG